MGTGNLARSGDGAAAAAFLAPQYPADIATERAATAMRGGAVRARRRGAATPRGGRIDDDDDDDMLLSGQILFRSLSLSLSLFLSL